MVPGRSAKLKQIYNRATHSTTGMGKRLFDDAIKYLRRREYDYICLAVSDINFRAQAFYSTPGFETIGRFWISRLVSISTMTRTF